MNLTPHALDQWLQGHAGPSIEFDLGSSTGPHWTLREVLALDGGDAVERLLDTELVYSRTAGGPALRDAIAAMQGVPAEHVVVLAGAAEALWHVFMISAEPGANVIVPFPCFPPHRTIPQALGLEVRSYHLRRRDGWRIDLDEVKRLADQNTRVLLVNLPHNPTGATISDAEMRVLHDFAAERGIQFVSDEVHHPIYHQQSTASAARLPHATSIGDFSKAFSLPGLRLGWLIDADPARRKHYLNAREYITISNSPVTEFAALIAVRHRRTMWERTSGVTGANLPLLDKLITEHADVVQWVRPQGGMTGFPWLVSGTDARELCQAAALRGLLLAPGDCFDAKDHFRVGFGVATAWFPRAMERFAGMLGDWRAHRAR